MYDILKEPLNFRENYNKTLYAVPISFSSLLMYIYLSSFISVFFHEIGHYFFYKYNYKKLKKTERKNYKYE